jgi:hypothetical protein
MFHPLLLILTFNNKKDEFFPQTTSDMTQTTHDKLLRSINRLERNELLRQMSRMQKEILD